MKHALTMLAALCALSSGTFGETVIRVSPDGPLSTPQAARDEVRRRAEEGDRVSKRLLKMVTEPSGFLSTIQIAITLSGFLGSAFAAQNLGVIREMEAQSGMTIDQEKWNPNGGAIAIGHPNGASGGRIAMFAMRQLEQTGGRYGLFSSCCGGGHGTTTIIENLRR